MNVICLVKFVPDVDHFKYDFEKQTLIRENSRLSLNPDDACAVAFALGIKNKYPEIRIEVVTMAPKSIVPHMSDLLRLGIDKGTILTDKDFAGSDTYATSKILSSYIQRLSYDCILTGTHAIDGDTSHVPAQIGEWLGLEQMSNIKQIDVDRFLSMTVEVEVEHETKVERFAIDLPAVLSLTRDSNYKLPYIKKADMSRDVSGGLQMIDRNTLNLDIEMTGLKGSMTRVKDTQIKQYGLRDNLVVKADREGAVTVIRFLKEKGLLP